MDKTRFTESRTGCIFCDAQPLTREEVFPAWIRPLLPKLGEDYQEHIQYRPVDVEQGLFVRNSLKINGHISRRQIKQFCARCNNGWMSRIETEAIPILSPAIQGKNAVITSDDFDVVRRWAALRVIVMDAAQDNKVIKKAIRQSFYKDKQRPERMLLWIGRCDYVAKYYLATSTASFMNANDFAENGNQIRRNAGTFLWAAGELVIFAFYFEKLPMQYFLPKEVINKLFPLHFEDKLDVEWNRMRLITESDFEVLEQNLTDFIEEAKRLKRFKDIR